MKKLNQIFLGILLVAVVAAGCDPLLDVNSDRLVYPNGHQLNQPNDTIYSMIGLFSELNKLADRYVLLGELRGDLLDLSADADANLQEIYNFDISKDNPYNKVADYYSVINNCNYIINNIDTSVVAHAEKVLMKEYAAVKAIRAWTYMQLALNYGKAKYYEKPILNGDQANQSYPELNIYELADKLIPDLEAVKNVKQLGGVSLGEDLTSDKSIFPVKFVLGDLYLWTGQYEQAALEYHDLIVDQSLVLNGNYQSTWNVDNGVFVSRTSTATKWPNMFDLSNKNNTELLTLIAGSTEYGDAAELDSLSRKSEITPSQVAYNNWSSQTYYYSATVTNDGDLRGSLGSYMPFTWYNIVYGEGSSTGGTFRLEQTNIISKFVMMSTSTSKAIVVYRKGLLYLRYAEAVNRTGKPNLAFAVLKNGMSPETMAVDTIVPRSEKYREYTDSTGTFYDYTNFQDFTFRNNIGVHERGCGDAHLAKDYVIPNENSLDDSMNYVEDKIVEELALETAFEGNRFHDLMRVALRRSDPSYLADKVAEKYTNNQGAIRTKLTDENNWYLKQ